MRKTWAGRKLAGYRGIPPADEVAVVDVLVKLSCLAMQHPSVQEIEINPLRVLGTGAVALDVRMIKYRNFSCHSNPRKIKSKIVAITQPTPGKLILSCLHLLSDQRLPRTRGLQFLCGTHGTARRPAHDGGHTKGRFRHTSETPRLALVTPS